MCQGQEPIEIRQKPFEIRASWATLLLSKAVPPVKVMAMGGWKDMKTMMIYIRKAGVDLGGATDCISLTNHCPNNLIMLQRQ